MSLFTSQSSKENVKEFSFKLVRNGVSEGVDLCKLWQKKKTQTTNQKTSKTDQRANVSNARAKKKLRGSMASHGSTALVFGGVCFYTANFFLTVNNSNFLIIHLIQTLLQVK